MWLAPWQVALSEEEKNELYGISIKTNNCKIDKKRIIINYLEIRNKIKFFLYKKQLINKKISNKELQTLNFLKEKDKHIKQGLNVNDLNSSAELDSVFNNIYCIKVTLYNY